MSVKMMKESELLDKTEIEDSSVPSFIERMTMILRSEEDAITEYDVLLGTTGLPDELREVIEEIKNDEKDHLILLTNAIQRYSNSEFSDNTDELDDLPYPDEDVEIVDVPDESQEIEDDLELGDPEID